MRRQGLAKALRKWIAVTDSKAQQNAQKAVLAMRRLGLAKALRKWIEVAQDQALQQNAKKALMAMRKQGLARGMRKWISVTDSKAQQNAQKAVLAMRRQGLAKALRKWVAVSDSMLLRQNAQKAVLAMRRQGLARGFRQWVAVTDSRAEQNAQKAVLAMRRQGLAKALRKWMAVSAAARTQRRAQRTLLRWSQQRLNRAVRKWVDGTDLEVRVRERLRRAVAKWYGGKMRVGFKQWVAYLIADRAARCLQTGSFARAQRASQQVAFEALARNAGHRSRVSRVVARSVAAWRSQALVSAFITLAALRDGERKWIERAGRAFDRLRKKELRWGFGRMKSAWTDSRLAKTVLGRVYGFGRAGALMRGMRAWQAFSESHASAGDVFETGLLQWVSARKPIALRLWASRAREMRMHHNAVKQYRHRAVAAATTRWRVVAAIEGEQMRVGKRAMAYWRGQKHALAFYDWRALCDRREQRIARTRAALKRARSASWGWCFAKWAEGVRARLAHATFLGEAINLWEKRWAKWAMAKLVLYAERRAWAAMWPGPRAPRLRRAWATWAAHAEQQQQEEESAAMSAALVQQQQEEGAAKSVALRQRWSGVIEQAGAVAKEEKEKEAAAVAAAKSVAVRQRWMGAVEQAGEAAKVEQERQEEQRKQDAAVKSVETRQKWAGVIGQATVAASEENESLRLAADARAAEAERMARAAAEAAASTAARTAAAAAAAVAAHEAAEDARRAQMEAERVSVLHALIQGCAEEITERQRLLGRWTVRSRSPSPQREALRHERDGESTPDEVFGRSKSRAPAVASSHYSCGVSASHPIVAPCGLSPALTASSAIDSAYGEEIGDEIAELQRWVSQHRPSSDRRQPPRSKAFCAGIMSDPPPALPGARMLWAGAGERYSLFADESH